jgi:hypothetical protein
VLISITYLTPLFRLNIPLCTSENLKGPSTHLKVFCPLTRLHRYVHIFIYPVLFLTMYFDIYPIIISISPPGFHLLTSDYSATVQIFIYSLSGFIHSPSGIHLHICAVLSSPPGIHLLTFAWIFVYSTPGIHLLALRMVFIYCTHIQVFIAHILVGNRLLKSM